MELCRPEDPGNSLEFTRLEFATAAFGMAEEPKLELMLCCVVGYAPPCFMRLGSSVVCTSCEWKFGWPSGAFVPARLVLPLPF